MDTTINCKHCYTDIDYGEDYYCTPINKCSILNTRVLLFFKVPVLCVPETCSNCEYREELDLREKE